MRYLSPALITAGMLIAAALWPSSVWSQANQQSLSFIKPFPQGNVYRLQIIGDWYADYVRGFIAKAMIDIGQVRTETSVMQIRSLRRSGWDKALAQIARASARQPIDIAVVMLGAAEFGPVYVKGKRIGLGSEAWRAEYTSRVDSIMKALKQNNTAVYWMGIPTLRNERHDDNAQVINEILRERSYINSIKYIDTYAGFANEEGGYDVYGPNLSGKIERLRSKDGIYFTAAGYRKLAHFAKRVIARDIWLAVSEQEIPLAGSELEQQRINSQPAVADQAQQREEGAADEAQQSQTARRLLSNTTSAPSPVISSDGLKTQKSDNTSIKLRTIRDGIAKTDTITILRPEISASVLAILTRSYSANRRKMFSQSVQVELPTGHILMHSITPSRQGLNERRQTQLSLSQSAFFRVWAKGERLTPRPGRSDDIEWPRPKPQPVTRAKLTPQPHTDDASNRPGRRERPSRKYTPEGFPPLPQLKSRLQ